MDGSGNGWMGHGWIMDNGSWMDALWVNHGWIMDGSDNLDCINWDNGIELFARLFQQIGMVGWGGS